MNKNKYKQPCCQKKKKSVFTDTYTFVYDKEWTFDKRGCIDYYVF